MYKYKGIIVPLYIVPRVILKQLWLNDDEWYKVLM